MRSEERPPTGLALGERWPVLVTMALWAIQVPAIGALGERWDPFTLALLRGSLGAAMLTALAIAVAGWRRRQARLPAARGLAIGALFAGFGLLYTVAAMIGDPVSVVTLGALAPLTAALIDWALGGARPGRAMLLALCLVIPGALLTVPAPAEPGGAGQGASHPITGMALMLVAQVAWAVYSLSVQAAMPGLSQLERTRLSVVWALPFQALALAIGAAAGLTGVAWGAAPALDAALILGVTAGPMVIGVMLWNVSVTRIGLGQTALHLNLIPVLGTLGAMAFGTWPSLSQLLGIALVIGGMTLTSPARPRAGAAAGSAPRQDAGRGDPRP